jgi:peptide/nickel transport system permease protein
LTFEARSYIGKTISFWRELLSLKSAFISFIFIGAVIISALFAEYIAPYDPMQMDTKNMLAPPELGHPFGTDYLGRDILSRVIYGGKVTLLVGFSAGVIMTAIGLLIGLLSGYFGGRVDLVLMRITEIFMTIPILPLLLLLVAIFGSSLKNVIFVIAILSWPSLARIVRAESMSVVKRDFIMAEVALGASHKRIIFYHVLPNITGSVIVYLILGIAWAILNEAALDFLGLAPFAISWGYDLSLSLNYWISGSWWMVFFPGFAIFLTCFSFFLLSDGLSAALTRALTGR